MMTILLLCMSIVFFIRSSLAENDIVSELLSLEAIAVLIFERLLRMRDKS